MTEIDYLEVLLSVFLIAVTAIWGGWITKRPWLWQAGVWVLVTCGALLMYFFLGG